MQILKSNIFRNLRNINPNSIGWCRPDGAIVFQNAETAQQYATNRVLRALRQKHPSERGILIDKNIIIKEFNGKQFEIKLPELPEAMTKGKIFVHGHPAKYSDTSTPLSLNDFLFFIGAKLKRITAYNSKGEYNNIEEKPSSLLYKILPLKIKDKLDTINRIGTSAAAIEKYAKMWSKLFPENLQKAVEQIMLCFHETFCTAKNKAELQKVINDKELIADILKIEERNFENGTAIKQIHKFWQKFAKQFNYIYSTNFSNLK